MSGDLKIMDMEFSAVGEKLSTQCATLQTILEQYQKIMSSTSIQGLTSINISNSIQQLTDKISPVSDSLRKSQSGVVDVSAQFISTIDGIDKF
jgi:hypothetical protein